MCLYHYQVRLEDMNVTAPRNFLWVDGHEVVPLLILSFEEEVEGCGDKVAAASCPCFLNGLGNPVYLLLGKVDVEHAGLHVTADPSSTREPAGWVLRLYLTSDLFQRDEL